mgnify:CR=1 FL=1
MSLHHIVNHTKGFTSEEGACRISVLDGTIHILIIIVVMLAVVSGIHAVHAVQFMKRTH